MNQQIKHVQALPNPDGKGHQITYENGRTRHVHRINSRPDEVESPPHGAGSFHDPEHHQKLMDRVDAMRR